MRWRHPERGLLLPERLHRRLRGLPAHAGAGRLGAAARRAAFLARHPDFAGQVFVNVSPRQIGRADLSRVVGEALDRTGVEPHRLGLEITESGVLKAVRLGPRWTSSGSRRWGSPWSLDDFGTGYSALSSILSAPVDGLKLDRSFTSRLGDDGAADRISIAMAALADSLHRYGVVEGVETEPQRTHALAHGWTHGQGWLFGRPAPEGELALRPRALTVSASVRRGAVTQARGQARDQGHHRGDAPRPGSAGPAAGSVVLRVPAQVGGTVQFLPAGIPTPQSRSWCGPLDLSDRFGERTRESTRGQHQVPDQAHRHQREGAPAQQGGQVGAASTHIRRVREAVAGGDKDAASTALVDASRKLDKAVSKGVIHAEPGRQQEVGAGEVGRRTLIFR